MVLRGLRLSVETARKRSDIPPAEVIFGTSYAMLAVRETIERAAKQNVPVLIWGESGTGKDMLARYIHHASPWHAGPYVKINCPAIPGALLESELFGYNKGGFTGANTTKRGRLEQGSEGTVFLDEISELEIGLQSKLLQVLQDGKFCRIGATEDTTIDVRLICATNRHLESEIEAGRFRQDLYYRINVVSVHAPPLRERVDDVPLLAEYFLAFYNEKYNCKAKSLTSKTMARLQHYHWPGNVRELENVLRRYVILGEEAIQSFENGSKVSYAIDLNVSLDTDISLKAVTKRAMFEFERRIILRMLQKHNWNRKKSARALKISYRALLYKLQDIGAGEGSGETADDQMRDQRAFDRELD